MDTNCLSTLLTETERGNGERLDAIGLNASTWVYDVIELLHDVVDVIGISVSRNQTAVEDLQTTVEHPGASSSLGVTSEILLEDAHNGITLLSAEMLQLLADDRRLILVV